MNNQNQLPQNPQMKLNIDPSKMQLPFNPQNLTSMPTNQFLPNMNLTSPFGGTGVPSDNYSHFLPGVI